MGQGFPQGKNGWENTPLLISFPAIISAGRFPQSRAAFKTIAIWCGVRCGQSGIEEEQLHA
jgi:hypothetical protein